MGSAKGLIQASGWQLLGRPEVIREKYSRVFGSGNWEEKVKRYQRRTGAGYVLALLVCGVLSVICGILGPYAEGESPWALLAFGGIMTFALIYMKRYDGPDREIREDKEAILRDYPDFVERLLLLLNSGLVLASALQRLGAEGKEPGASPLYRELYRLYIRVKESNSSLTEQFQQFAAGLGLRELMRFSAILSHSLQKGSSLQEKLEAERELLLNSRKAQLQEWNRQAETKLVFPLMIQLLVLIFITIMPAMMSM